MDLQLVKNIHRYYSSELQAHFYQPYGHFETKRQTPFIDISASKIRAKCVSFFNRLRI